MIKINEILKPGMYNKKMVDISNKTDKDIMNFKIDLLKDSIDNVKFVNLLAEDENFNKINDSLIYNMHFIDGNGIEIGMNTFSGVNHRFSRIVKDLKTLSKTQFMNINSETDWNALNQWLTTKGYGRAEEIGKLNPIKRIDLTIKFVRGFN